MTINKAQDQTFDKVGIHLEEPVLTHGQLYDSYLRANDLLMFVWKYFQHHSKEDMITHGQWTTLCYRNYCDANFHLHASVCVCVYVCVRKNFACLQVCVYTLYVCL